MIRDGLFLAIRYLGTSVWRTTVLILGLTVAAFLPLFTFLSAELVGGALMRRAESSPVLIGTQGNEFDLTMSSLYFRGQVSTALGAGVRHRLRQYGLAVPLYVAYTSDEAPIVGTSLEYFEARGLELAAGRLPALIGELVAGAEVSKRYDLQPGDTVRSDLSNLYNIAGSYPILLRVVGILAPSNTPDDEAYFADLKTTWMLDGRFHGHVEIELQESLNPEADEGENLEASAAIFLFTEPEERILASYHMHGDESEAPLTSVLVFPDSQREHDQLLGDFRLDEHLQAVRPTVVMRTVLGIVLRVREGLSLYFGTVALSTLAFVSLVISLSLRLRWREIGLMRRIGCSRSAIATIVGAEVFLVAAAAALLTAGLTVAGLSLVEQQLGL